MGVTLLNRLILTWRTCLPFAMKKGLCGSCPLDWLFAGYQSGKFGKFVELDFKMLNWYFNCWVSIFKGHTSFKTRKGFYVPKYDDINSRLVYWCHNKYQKNNKPKNLRESNNNKLTTSTYQIAFYREKIHILSFYFLFFTGYVYIYMILLMDFLIFLNLFLKNKDRS